MDADAITLRPLDRGEWAALALDAAEQDNFVEALRRMVAFPVAFALTDDDALEAVAERLAFVEGLPFGVVLDLRRRLVALSVAHLLTPHPGGES